MSRPLDTERQRDYDAAPQTGAARACATILEEEKGNAPHTIITKEDRRMRRHGGLIPLSHDHQHALALCVLTERELGTNGGAEAASRAAAEIVRAFDGEILDHFQFEERVLFPVCEGFESLVDIVSDLKSEHSRMVGLVAGLRSNGGKARVLEFCATLRNHVRREESLLFEQAQQLLSDEQLNEIGRKRQTPA
jgi:hemerythrin-like domain-containing protein